MALLTERCLFINFPFYIKTFVPEMDFDWNHHQQRLLSFGHDVTKTPPHLIQVCTDMPIPFINLSFAFHAGTAQLEDSKNRCGHRFTSAC